MWHVEKHDLESITQMITYVYTCMHHMGLCLQLLLFSYANMTPSVHHGISVVTDSYFVHYEAVQWSISSCNCDMEDWLAAIYLDIYSSLATGGLGISVLVYQSTYSQSGKR